MSTRWRSVLIGALLLFGLTSGMVIAAAPDWPAWTGTQPVNLSNSTWDVTWQPVIATGSSGQVVFQNNKVVP